jgi:gliding motility-associated-like protein
MERNSLKLILALVFSFFLNGIFAQTYLISTGGTINACAGSFTDAGGSGNYANNETYTMTFCSGASNEIAFDFSNFPFGLQANNDVLTIWDGPVVASGASLWSSIPGNGLVNPGIIISTTGCLTFEFVSDGVTNNIGWEALISCPSCTDGVMNGYETGIDCGGPSCLPCASCFDGVQNQNETGIDCGGICTGITPPCHCGNGILDGDETDVDCGGSCAPCLDSCNVTASVEPTLVPGGCCDYTLEMYDSWGDGWNGGQMDLLLNGVSQGPFTLASGAMSSQTITMCTGDNIQVNYTAVGGWSNEVSYVLLDPQGNLVCQGNGLSVVNNVYSGIVQCLIPSIIDCNGGSFTLVAQGIGASVVLMNNNFDSGSMGTGWSSNVTADFSNPCDPSLDGGTYMWMGNSAQHPREIETIPLDVSCGGEICFLLDFATQGFASPCEGIDLADEGVYLEYSIDGGVTWVTMEYYGPAGVGNNYQPAGTNPQMTSWNQYCLPIPAAAMTAATQFHWAQTGSSGLNNDHWGIDNVTISSVANCDPYLYDWTQVPGNDNSPIQVENITSDTTFTVWYGNTTDACSTEVTITIPPPPMADAGVDQLFCLGGSGITIGGSPVTPEDSTAFTWSTGDTGIVVLSGIPIVNGQIVVGPSITTDYFLEVDLNGCTGYDTVTVVVDMPPMASNPDTINVQCVGNVPAPDPFEVSDESDDFTIVPIVTFIGDLSDGLSCPETITRTYRITDDCNNYVDVTQAIVVMDTIPPVMDLPPTAVSVQCIGDVPQMIDLGWTDNCDGAGVVGGVDVSDGQSCPEIIIRTWIHTDSCGNVANSVSQQITIQDTISPVFNTIPLDTTVQCIGDVLSMLDLTWVDNCDGTGSVVGIEVSNGQSCPEIITRTWSYTDTCGNSTTVSQTITIMDTVAPVFSFIPLDTTVQCIGDVPLMLDLTWADNCDGIGTVVGLEMSNGQSCPEIITRTWTYTDDCGNSTAVSQLIAVMDTIPPTASNLPTLSITGGAPLPQFNVLDVFDEADNCSSNIVVAYVGDVSNGANCPEIFTRTYSITDECGNQSFVTQLINVGDAFIPTASNPLPVNVQCSSNIPSPDPLVVTDEADNGAVPIVTWEDDTSNGMSCPEIIVRRYRVTDDCGNFILVSQTITVNDTIPPVLDIAPGDVTVLCPGDVPTMISLAYSDNCDGVGSVLGFDNQLTNSCGGTIIRTWTYVDSCGNSATVTQNITVNDTIPPIASAPASINVECPSDVPMWDILSVTNESDNCTLNPTVNWAGDLSDGLSCPETIIRTYSITDACGNQVLVEQLITVNDITPPTASNPTTISVSSINDVPLPDSLVVIDEADNCTLYPVVTWVSDVSDGNVCDSEEITRTYSIMDECGNETFVTQLIIILAGPAPIDAGPDQTICLGDSASINVINPLNASLTWSPALPPQPFSPIQSQTYTVTADYYGCISTDDVSIFIATPPTVNFTADILTGCEPLQVEFTNLTTAQNGFSNCEWTINGETIYGCDTVSYLFENAGTYDVSLSVTTIEGCTSTQTFFDYINVYEVPLSQFSMNPNSISSFDNVVQFSNNSINADLYEWDFGDQSAISMLENPSHTYNAVGNSIYTITLWAYEEHFGCVDSIQMSLVGTEELIYYVPNTFTPDGDTYNETFQPVFTEGYDPYDFHLLIFNRWGEIVFESFNAEIGWNGLYKGKLAQDGTYTWKIEFKETMTDKRHTAVGHVSIIR